MLNSEQEPEILESLLENQSVDSNVIRRQNKFITYFLITGLLLSTGLIIYHFII